MAISSLDNVFIFAFNKIDYKNMNNLLCSLFFNT